MLQLFSFRDQPNLFDSQALKDHAVKVMRAVGGAVAGLSDVAKLIPVLSMLGKKHLAYGVMPEHYDVVGQAGSSLRTSTRPTLNLLPLLRASGCVSTLKVSHAPISVECQS